MKAYVMAEHADEARALCAGARKLADEVVYISLGDKDVPDDIADEIVIIEVPKGEAIEDAAETVMGLVGRDDSCVVMAEPTRRLGIVAGKVAAQVNTSVITDVLSFCDDGMKSLYFGGIAERVRKATGPVVVCTVRSGVFADLEAFGDNVERAVDWVAPAQRMEVVSETPLQKAGEDLNAAPIVVAAGRGFTTAESLELAKDLAKTLGAGLACSRPLTEGEGLLPREIYVGVSGLSLSPKVYVACGISGQMQHMVGCNRAGELFAVASDKNSPIFDQCDYGLVGTVEDVLPRLTAQL